MEQGGERLIEGNEEDDPSAQMLLDRELPLQQFWSHGSAAPPPASTPLWALPPQRRRPRARSRVLLRELIDEDVPRPWYRSCWVSRRNLMLAAGATMLVVVGLASLLVSLHERNLTRAAGVPVQKAISLGIQCKKVICVGTSITKGDPILSKTPYPTKLQELLGPEYCVHNYGSSEITVLKHTSTSIWTSPRLQEMEKMQPDIVVMQFGARDTMENAFQPEFHQDYAALIQTFRNLPSRPEVYVMSIPPIYPGTASQNHPDKAYGMLRTRVNSLHKPLHEVAKDSKLQPPISVFNVFRNKCPDMSLKCLWMSTDGVHPNMQGNGVIAGLVHSTIVDDDRCPLHSTAPRTICGAPGISQAQCRDLRCCWQPSGLGGRCVHKVNPVKATPMQCFVTTFEKTECGYHSDNMHQCMAKGCCYKPSLDGSPWCYHKKVAAYTPPKTTQAPTTLAPTTTTFTTRTFTVTHTTITATHTRTTMTVTWTTVTATVSTTTTSTTTTSTTTGTTTTTTTWVSLIEQGYDEAVFLEHQKWARPVLVAGTILLSSAVFSWLILNVVRCLNEDQVSAASEIDARNLQDDEERRQLRRLEVDMALRRVEENRRQRELDSMLTSAGFTGVNDPKAKKGVFRTGYQYPLHAAVEANSPEAVQMLVRAGADVNLLDSKKRTPLQMAEQMNKNDSHQEVIIALGEA